MKKQIIILMLVLLLVGTIIGQVILTRNIDVTFDRDTKDKLAEYNITEPRTTELVCDNDICEFKMYDGDYNLGTHRLSRRYCSEVNQSINSERECLELTNFSKQELLNEQDKIIKEWLENYAIILRNRENIQIKTKVGDEVVITIR